MPFEEVIGVGWISTAASGWRGAVTLPEWWDWELDLTPHVEKRMEDRGFTEVDLRDMLERAAAFRPDVVEGRFVLETRFHGRKWRWLSSPTKLSIFSWSSPRTEWSHEAALPRGDLPEG